MPNSGAGPFRPLKQPELGNVRSAPNALEDDDLLPRDASVLDDDGDPATLGVHAYAAATLVPEEEQPPSPDLPPNAILRYGALDGRSFDRSAEQVLLPAAVWEGGTVGAPSAVRLGTEVLLFHGAEGGIGVARGGDGVTFPQRGDAPVLGPDASGWENGAVPSHPGVVVLDDGSLRMFYEVDPAGDGHTRIGEARSTDGATWTRVGSGPALDLGTAADVPAGEAVYDDSAVGAPAPVLATMANGERVLRLYYAATDASGAHTIGLAAREGDGPLSRAVSPVFGTGSSLGPRAPCVVGFGDFSFLFATQRTGVSQAENHPAVAAGVAPATIALPPPDPL